MDDFPIYCITCDKNKRKAGTMYCDDCDTSDEDDHTCLGCGSETYDAEDDYCDDCNTSEQTQDDSPDNQDAIYDRYKDGLLDG